MDTRIFLAMPNVPVNRHHAMQRTAGLSQSLYLTTANPSTPHNVGHLLLFVGVRSVMAKA